MDSDEVRLADLVPGDIRKVPVRKVPPLEDQPLDLATAILLNRIADRLDAIEDKLTQALASPAGTDEP
jgi:hypothetical protein